MEKEEITMSIKLNEETKNIILKKVNETDDLNQKIQLLVKIKSIDMNINFYKNMIKSKSKFINQLQLKKNQKDIGMQDTNINSNIIKKSQKYKQ